MYHDCYFFLMIPRPPRSTRTDTPFPSTSPFRAPDFELRPAQPGKGFDLLPRPQAGDLFYDIEGDPHYEGGLEYLHGVWADDSFHAFWAHDHAAEAQALERLLAFFRNRLTAYPQARIYHYAPYRSEEHTSELQSLMRISYAVFRLKKKNK